MYITSETQLRSLLPNTVAAIAGEKSLFDKLASFFPEAEHFWERNTATSLNPNSSEYVQIDTQNGDTDWPAVAVACHAFRNAVHSLDLVLTPNGFAVASSDHIAPASKERVAALRQELENRRDRAIETFMVQRQLSSTVFPDTLFPGFALEEQMGSTDGLLMLHKTHIPRILRTEDHLAQRVIGPTLLHALRDLRFTPENYDDDLRALYELACQYELQRLKNGMPQPLRQLERDMVALIRNAEESPDMLSDWQTDGIGRYWKDNTFRNDQRKGGMWL